MAIALASTVTVGSGGANAIQFSNISQTGKDLLILVSLRDSDSNATWELRFNGDTAASDYTYRAVEGEGSSVSNYSYTDTNIWGGYGGGSGDTSNTFGNGAIYVSNYTSSSFYKSISIDNVSENNGTTARQRLLAGSYNKNTAITSLSITAFDGLFVQNSTVSLYVVDASEATATSSLITPKASGGTVTLSGGYFYHTFTTSGTFTPTQNLTCDYVIVGGGGAAGAVGSNDVGGGGGGGAVYTSLSYSGITQQSAYSATASTNYTVTVGAAGVGADPGTGGTGGNSSVFGYTAVGGGGGGWQNTGANGGSGGGGGAGSGGNYGGGTGTTGQGKNGGSGGVGGNISAGGGGGATVAGGNNSGNTSGAGGDGVNLNIAGVTWVAGGGYGGRNTSANGGVFGTIGQGGGSGNYGGGGLGGTRRTSGTSAGGNGGPGLVIIRYSAT